MECVANYYIFVNLQTCLLESRIELDLVLVSYNHNAIKDYYIVDI